MDLLVFCFAFYSGVLSCKHSLHTFRSRRCVGYVCKKGQRLCLNCAPSVHSCYLNRTAYAVRCQSQVRQPSSQKATASDAKEKRRASCAVSSCPVATCHFSLSSASSCSLNTIYYSVGRTLFVFQSLEYCLLLSS